MLTGGDNWELLAAQAKEFMPSVVVIAQEVHYGKLCRELQGTNTKVLCGIDELENVVKISEVEVVVVAVVGFAGLAPTIAAIKAQKRVALANKESLVVGGDIIMPLAAQNSVDIMPIDSEHSAIFQCLVGELNPPRRIILTASGGSVRTVPMSKLRDVSAEQVLCHPVWNMGARITVDSATMLNKGFEVIEAAHLFRVRGEEIQVVIHPEGIIHSAVEFSDRAIKAQMSYPDMRLAIQYALTYPERMEVKRLQSFDPFIVSRLSFDKPDPQRYPCLQLAYHALKQGGVLPTVLNAAGEVAVEAFLSGEIKFTNISEIIDQVLCTWRNQPLKNLEDIYETDAEARIYTRTLI